jgi:hypothetical protein
VNRATSKHLALVTTAAALAVSVVAVSVVAAPAGALGAARGSAASTAAQCKGTSLKPLVHDDAVRREAKLAALVADLQARRDPFGLNGPQISALQAASVGIAALDSQIAGTCYPTLAALRADATKLFVDYRVFWLRVPQTHVIEAADRLDEARSRLAAAAELLAGQVGTNASAQRDLAAMNQALSSADAKLGTPPSAGPSIVAVAGLQPAADMSDDTAVLRGAHADLLAVRASLAEARADGLKVLADLNA